MTTAVTDAQRRIALLGAIAALEADVLEHEREAAGARALISQLCVRAGLSIEERREAVKNLTDEGHSAREVAQIVGGSHETAASDVRNLTAAAREQSRARNEETAKTKPKTTAAPARPDQAAVEELKKIVGLVAEATAEEVAAMHDKNPARLKAAMAAVARAERAGGECLIRMAGKVRPLPGISKIEAKRWRRAAGLSEKDFEGKLQRAQSTAVAAISSGGVTLRPPKKVSAPPKARPDARHLPPRRRENPSTFPLRLATKLTPWKKDAAGVLSRTLTAVDAKDAANGRRLET